MLETVLDRWFCSPPEWGSEIAINPISKMDVAASTATLVCENEGKKYYFCSSHCKETFRKNPEQYKDQDFRE
jgi:YHS domain-containing protein